MMKLKHVIKGVFTIVILAFLVTFALYRANLAKDNSNFERLKVGMVKQEVKTLMGEPKGSWENRYTYELSNPAPFISVIGIVAFKNDTVAYIRVDTID